MPSAEGEGAVSNINMSTVITRYRPGDLLLRGRGAGAHVDWSEVLNAFSTLSDWDEHAPWSLIRTAGSDANDVINDIPLTAEIVIRHGGSLLQ